MNSNSINFATLNKRVSCQNYSTGPNTNPIQAPINNFNQIIPQYGSPQPININPIQTGYNPVNTRPFQINPTYQQPNIRASPSNHNENIIQPQHFIQNTPNLIYN